MSRYCKRYEEKERVIDERAQSTQTERDERVGERYQSHTSHAGLGVETKVRKGRGGQVEAVEVEANPFFRKDSRVFSREGSEVP